MVNLREGNTKTNIKSYPEGIPRPPPPPPPPARIFGNRLNIAERQGWNAAIDKCVADFDEQFRHTMIGIESIRTMLLNNKV